MTMATFISPRGAAFFRAPSWLKISVLGCLGYVACLLAGFQARGSGRNEQLFSTALFCVLYFFAAGAMGRAARRRELPPPVRSCLRFITAALVLNGLGATYLFLERYLNPISAQAVFSVADGFFLSLYPVLLLGLARLPAGELPGARWGRILVDAAVFVVGVGVPLWLFALQPQLRLTTGVEALLLVVWPLTAFCGIFGVNAALLTKAPLPSRGALWLLLGGCGISALADLVFSLDAAVRIITRGSIDWVNVFNALSVTLYLLAAWRFQSDPVPTRLRAQSAAFSPVPLFTIVVVAAWLMLLASGAQAAPGALALVLPGLILLFGVLFVREILVMRDSQRWMAAEAQRESQARFEALIRNSSDVIMIVDPTRRIRFASPAATKLLGLTPEMLLGRDLLALAHPDDAARGARFLDELRETPGATRFLNWRLRHHEKTFCHLETAGSNLLHDTMIEGFVLNSRDVTERLAIEEHLHKAAKMEAISRLAGGVAHDFNNLLTVVLANSELALMDLPADHSVRKDLEQVRQASFRGTALTSRLLSFSRSESLQPRIINPAERLQSIIPVVQRLIEPHLTLLINVESTAGQVKVNPDSFEQTLLHLASNARDASPAGGTLTFSIRRVTLAKPLASSYLAAPPGRYVVIEAADTGTGMDEATRAKLFEPFFTTKERGRGTGLGLASVYGTVKTAGSGLTVVSNPGQGTTIGMWLPEVIPDPAPAMPIPTGTNVGGSETILLVEDEPLVRQAAHRILLAKGYDVLVACDADDARRVLGSHAGQVHLLLTDVMMPGQSGPALAADLVKLRPGLRVLYMSGYTGNELGAHGLVHSDVRLLVKPFTVDELTARLRTILAGPPGMA